MCTIVALSQVFADHPLVVIANRDEALDRASSPPGLWSSGFLAPRDDVAGGTWLGVTKSGVFVGITNRFLGPKALDRESRGAIVARVLDLPSARAIHEHMATVSPTKHNGFHLFYADDQDVLATASDGAHLAQLVLGRGTHVITERSFGAGDDGPRTARILAALERLAPMAGRTDRPPDLDRLSTLLTEHDEADPLTSTCIHFPAANYGTRSGMALAIASDRPKSRMLWADGPPCTTPFGPVDVAGILDVPGIVQTG